MDHYIKAESVELVHSGNHFFEVTKEMIRSAKKTIHLQTFIFSEDATGKEIAEELINAATRGVKIWILPDGYGSKEMSKTFIAEFRKVGIQFRFFSPLFSSESRSQLRRLHHKILVVDKTLLLVGGINIGNKYHGTEKEMAWLDYAVLVKGKCAAQVHDFCDMLYRKKNIFWEDLREMSGEIPIRFRVNDWLRGKNEIYRSYKNAFRRSHHSVTVVGCYFLPGFFFLRYIINAVKRGVKVKIIVGAISDIPFFHSAEKYLYDYLLRNGVEIYEWNGSVLHGKAAIVDDEWCTIGSYNLNNLSKYKTIEFNVDIKDVPFAQKFQEHINSILTANCSAIKQDHFKKKGLFTKLRMALAYYYYRFFMYLVSSRE
jgi:cardiolipin synthase